MTIAGRTYNGTVGSMATPLSEGGSTRGYKARVEGRSGAAAHVTAGSHHVGPGVVRVRAGDRRRGKNRGATHLRGLGGGGGSSKRGTAIAQQARTYYHRAAIALSATLTAAATVAFIARKLSE